MQLYAFAKNDLIFVDDAKKGVSYTCCECSQEVRVRGGRYNIRHFFHVKPKKKCEFRRRSMIHLAIQMAIARAFPKGEIALEFPMKKIKRRADAYWKSKNIVFEVQCSRITMMEITRREHDYRKEGCRVIWILSDRKFNKKFVTPAEKELRKRPCYYANHAYGINGQFYDQFEVIRKSRRIRKYRPLRIRLRSQYKLAENTPVLPAILEQRESFFVHGDLMDRALRYPQFCQALIEAEERANSKKKADLLLLLRSEASLLLSEAIKSSANQM